MSTPWKEMTTDQRIVALCNQITATPNASASELGAALGCGKSAVMGLIHRNRETIEWGRQAARAVKKVKRVPARPKPAPARKDLKFGKPVSFEPLPPRPVKHDPAFDPLTPIGPWPDLEHLGRDCCKWSVGEAPTVFCGCASETGRYCPTHEMMSGKQLPPVTFK